MPPFTQWCDGGDLAGGDSADRNVVRRDVEVDTRVGCVSPTGRVRIR